MSKYTESMLTYGRAQLNWNSKILSQKFCWVDGGWGAYAAIFLLNFQFHVWSGNCDLSICTFLKKTFYVFIKAFDWIYGNQLIFISKNKRSFLRSVTLTQLHWIFILNSFNKLLFSYQDKKMVPEKNEKLLCEKAFVRTKESVWHQNEDYVGGATCWIVIVTGSLT